MADGLFDDILKPAPARPVAASSGLFDDVLAETGGEELGAHTLQIIDPTIPQSLALQPATRSAPAVAAPAWQQGAWIPMENDPLLVGDTVDPWGMPVSAPRDGGPLAPAAPPPEPPGFLDVLGSAFRRGGASSIAGALHTGADFIDQTVGGAIRNVAQPLGLGETFTDPLGAAGVARDALGAEQVINADRAAAAAAIGGRPTLGEALEHPLGAAKRYGLHLTNIGAESLPAFAAAIATRNPELAAGALGTLTGAQEYTDLRGQGVDRGDAAQAAVLTGAIETAGEAFGLPAVMGRGGRGSLLRAMLSEGAQEAPVQVGQQQVEDVATGQQTPVLQQLGDALDAFLVGAGLGAGGHGLSVATEKLAGQAETPPPPEPRRGSALSSEDIAATQVLGDVRPTTPATTAATAASAAPAVARPSPQGSQPLGEPGVEDTSDLDALLARNVPPLGEQPAAPAAEPTDFAQQVEASRRMRAEAPPARTQTAPAVAAPTGQPAPAPVGGSLLPESADRPTPLPRAEERPLEDLTPAERAAFDRGQGAFVRQRIAPTLAREQGEADADANGLRPAVDAVVGQSSVPVEYVRGIAGLPDAVRTDIESRNRSGRKVRTAALYDPASQRVFILTDNVTDPQRAAWHAAHEIAGHHGLRALVRDRAGLDAALDDATQHPTVARLADAIAGERKSADRRLMAEEAIAELAAATRTGNYDEIASRYGVQVPQAARATLRGAIARFVQRLRALFGKRAGFSDADLHGLVENAWKAARTPGATSLEGDALEAADRRPFAQQVAERAGAPMAGGPMLDAGRSPAPLRMVGAPDLPLRMPPNVLAKLEGGKGGTRAPLTAKQIARLPEEIDDPVAVFRDPKRPDNLIVQTALVDAEGLPVQVAIRPNGNDGHERANIVLSAFGRANAEDWVRRAELLYLGEKTNPRLPQSLLNQRQAEGEAEGSGAKVLRPDDMRNFRAASRGKPLESAELAQTDTQAFKRWFGDSKVVDGEGKPLVVYHGTSGNFDAFRGDDGHFFGTADIASDYATSSVGEAPSVYPVFLSIKNPARNIDPENLTDASIARLSERGFDGVIYNEGQPDVEYVAFRPEQIKSATGNSGAFDPNNPSILESVDDARSRAEARRNEAAETLPVDRGTAGWNYDTDRWEGRQGALRIARANLQDKMIAWRDVQDQIVSQVGAATPDAQNVYRLENLMHGRVGEAIDRIERDQVQPLMDAMRAAKVDPATLEEYLYARHAKERNAEVAKINTAMPDGGSGMTNAEADAVLAKADKTTLEPLARRVDGIVRGNRRRMLNNGLITQEAFDAMEAQYQHYVPLRGKATKETEFDARGGIAGRGLDSRGKLVRNALGRGAGNRAQHILAEVIGDAQRTIIVAEKARVGRAVMRLVLANPNPDLWTVEPVQTERKLDANNEVVERVVNDWSDPSIIAVKHKGQLFKVQINSEPLAQALNNVGVASLHPASRVAGAINRYFSAILTKYNPAFTPVNATRDAIFGMTGMAAEHGEAAALDAALHYPQAARAAYRQARGKAGDSQWDRWAAEFAQAGGKTGYVNMPSAEDIARKIGSGKLTSYTPEGLARAGRAIGDAIGNLNDAVENALRLSAYVTLRKRGASPDAAAAYAKDLTVNFNRKGFNGSGLNAWFLFYNASLQGAHRTSKLLRHPKTWAYLGTLAAAQVIATLAAMGMEDDNGDPLWNQVPDHVKRRNLVVVLPDGGMVTVPMPYGFNLFPYLAGRITEAVANGQRGEKRAQDSALQLTADTLSASIESFSPVPLDDGAFGLLPTALRIPANIQANRNDFGRPIRREDAFGKSDVPRASMGRPDTLEVFKLTATGLNRLGGGDEYTPPPMSALDVAPEDIEYVWDQLTGGPGRLVSQIATAGQKTTVEQPLTARDIPILNRFVTAIDKQASQQALYYQRREDIDRALKRVRAAYREQGPAAAERLLRATPELAGAAFRRRKRDSENGAAGSIVESDGGPQLIVSDFTRVYGRYKLAEKAIEARNADVEAAYGAAPAGLLPNRERDAKIRAADAARMEAQAALNAAWVRDVVGAAE